jgi:molybdenum-dependent DNA-binding transcriptional regulator ModE
MREERGRAARADGFHDERKALFLAALRHGYSTLAACRLVGISNRTAYNHRRDEPDFARDWALVRRMATLPLELVAFERAVDGVEEPVYAYGKLSHVRVRRSDSLLVALLAAETPEKFGRTAGARAQGKLTRRLKRLARRVEALEARLEADEVRTVRNAETVNFMNRRAAPAAPAWRRIRRERKPAASRLATARRRAAGGRISVLPGKS